MARLNQCRNCGCDFPPHSDSRGIYCSIKCQKDYEWKQTKLRIEQTGQIENSRQGRRYLLEKNGHKCEICGRSTWLGQPIPLVLDHKDGNSDNWALSNIRLICCNDDAMTDTYKNRNKGHGRAYRRERYHSGQSY